jgi:hypothetical protein
MILHSTRQRIFGTFVQTADILAAVSLLVDFEKRADKRSLRQVFHSETDGKRCAGKSLVAERLTPRQSPSGREQLGRGVVIKFGHRSGPLERNYTTFE